MTRAVARAAVTEAEVLAALVTARVELWRDPAAATAPAPEAAEPTGRPDVPAVTRAVRRWSRVVPRASCLVQAIAARRVLAGRGVAAELHFGVSPLDEGVHAHAWLELGGVAIVGEGPGTHARLHPTPRAR